METVVVVIVLAVILGLAAFYVIKARRSGQKCIGCPNSKSCSGTCGCCSGSQQQNDQE